MRTEGRKDRKGWRFWLSAGGLLAAAGVLAGLIRYTRHRVDLGAVVAAMKPGWLLAAGAAVPLAESLDALLCYMMGRHRGDGVSLGGCLASSFIGELYYNLGPVGVPVQVELLRDAGFTGAQAASVFTWKTMAATAVQGAFAALGLGYKLLLRPGELGWGAVPAGIITAGYGVLCALMLGVSLRPEQCARLSRRVLLFLDRKIKWFRRRGRTEAMCRRAAEFCAQVGAVWEDKALVGRLFLGMGVKTALLFAVPAWLYLGFGLRGAGLGDLVLTQGLVAALAQAVPLPGNAGGAEGSFCLLMAPLFGRAVAVAAVVWRLITFAGPMVLGGSFLALRGVIRWRGNRGKRPLLP